MAQLSLRGVRKNFKNAEVLQGIDLDIRDRELIVFVGPSGCGKSTLLRLIAGLDPMTAGEFVLNGKSMQGVAPSKRDIAMVFQSYALYPHMNVYDNMAFGARLMGLSKAEVQARIDEAAGMLQLEPLLDRKPRELSGGQRQRVAIGRALARKPSVFLLDEPLSNLDAALRSDVRLEIAKLHRKIGATMIYVTHDQVEAMTLADRIVVMRGGLIEQVGTPRELYETPANAFVGTFIGSPRMSLLETTRDGPHFGIEGSGSIALPGAPETGQKVTLGLRPDAMHLGLADAPDGFDAEFEYAEYLGNEAYLYARLGDGTRVSLKGDTASCAHQPGDTVRVCPDPAQLHYFDTETGRSFRSA